MGYCGADLKVQHQTHSMQRVCFLAPRSSLIVVHGTPAQALCIEASLHALRRSYPQIYEADEKLLVDPKAVTVGEKDFEAAQLAITPASHRAAAAPARLGPAACCATLRKQWVYKSSGLHQPSASAPGVSSLIDELQIHPACVYDNVCV